MRSVFKLLFVFNEAGSLTEPGALIFVSQASHLLWPTLCIPPESSGCLWLIWPPGVFFGAGDLNLGIDVCTVNT